MLTFCNVRILLLHLLEPVTTVKVCLTKSVRVRYCNPANIAHYKYYKMHHWYSIFSG